MKKLRVSISVLMALILSFMSFTCIYASELSDDICITNANDSSLTELIDHTQIEDFNFESKTTFNNKNLEKHISLGTLKDNLKSAKNNNIELFGLTADNNETYESMSENNNEEIDDYIVDMGNNPIAHRTGRLTQSTPEYFYFFTITETNKFVLARLISDYNYKISLLYYDNSGNIYDLGLNFTAGELIQLNGVPEGNFIFYIVSNNEPYGQKFSFDINATNPASNISNVSWISLDLSIFIFENSSGDVYSNGNLVYNKTTGIGNNLDWERIEERRWESGYQQRTHGIFNVHVKDYSQPVTYTSRYASSDCAIFIFCDIDTGFNYYYSYYQSGPEHYYLRQFEDITGKRTPRPLDESDFEAGNNHILVYDINKGKTIDFYSSLNVYYGAGIEPAPTFSKLLP